MSRIEVVIALGAGVGVGAVVGIIMGLSASPVVGTVLGALSAGLLVLLGLNNRPSDALSSLRVAAFGIACMAAILLGIAVRTHSWLSPNVHEEVARWTSAGFSPQQAQQLVLFERTGILQKDWSTTTKSAASSSELSV